MKLKGMLKRPSRTQSFTLHASVAIPAGEGGQGAMLPSHPDPIKIGHRNDGCRRSNLLEFTLWLHNTENLVENLGWFQPLWMNVTSLENHGSATEISQNEK